MSDSVPAQPAEILAKRFHDAYELLAEQFGYETRPESRKPWAEVPEKNRKLMIATCAAILPLLPTPDAGFKLTAVCGVCGDKLVGDGSTPHQCHVAAKLDPLERELVAGIMYMDFCDHFCCGLPPRACHAKALASWIRECSERLTEVVPAPPTEHGQ